MTMEKELKHESLNPFVSRATTVKDIAVNGHGSTENNDREQTIYFLPMTDTDEERDDDNGVMVYQTPTDISLEANDEEHPSDLMSLFRLRYTLTDSSSSEADPIFSPHAESMEEWFTSTVACRSANNDTANHKTCADQSNSILSNCSQSSVRQTGNDEFSNDENDSSVDKGWNRSLSCSSVDGAFGSIECNQNLPPPFDHRRLELLSRALCDSYAMQRRMIQELKMQKEELASERSRFEKELAHTDQKWQRILQERQNELDLLYQNELEQVTTAKDAELVQASQQAAQLTETSRAYRKQMQTVWQQAQIKLQTERQARSQALLQIKQVALEIAKLRRDTETSVSMSEGGEGGLIFLLGSESESTGADEQDEDDDVRLVFDDIREDLNRIRHRLSHVQPKQLSFSPATSNQSNRTHLIKYETMKSQPTHVQKNNHIKDNIRSRLQDGKRATDHISSDSSMVPSLSRKVEESQQIETLTTAQAQTENMSRIKILHVPTTEEEATVIPQPSLLLFESGKDGADTTQGSSRPSLARERRRSLSLIPSYIGKRSKTAVSAAYKTSPSQEPPRRSVTEKTDKMPPTHRLRQLRKGSRLPVKLRPILGLEQRPAHPLKNSAACITDGSAERARKPEKDQFVEVRVDSLRSMNIGVWENNEDPNASADKAMISRSAKKYGSAVPCTSRQDHQSLKVERSKLVTENRKLDMSDHYYDSNSQALDSESVLHPLNSQETVKWGKEKIDALSCSLNAQRGDPTALASYQLLNISQRSHEVTRKGLQYVNSKKKTVEQKLMRNASSFSPRDIDNPDQPSLFYDSTTSLTHPPTQNSCVFLQRLGYRARISSPVSFISFCALEPKDKLASKSAPEPRGSLTGTVQNAGNRQAYISARRSAATKHSHHCPGESTQIGPLQVSVNFVVEAEYVPALDSKRLNFADAGFGYALDSHMPIKRGLCLGGRNEKIKKEIKVSSIGKCILPRNEALVRGFHRGPNPLDINTARRLERERDVHEELTTKKAKAASVDQAFIRCIPMLLTGNIQRKAATKLEAPVRDRNAPESCFASITKVILCESTCQRYIDLAVLKMQHSAARTVQAIFFPLIHSGMLLQQSSEDPRIELPKWKCCLSSMKRLVIIPSSWHCHLCQQKSTKQMNAARTIQMAVRSFLRRCQQRTYMSQLRSYSFCVRGVECCRHSLEPYCVAVRKLILCQSIVRCYLCLAWKKKHYKAARCIQRVYASVIARKEFEKQQTAATRIQALARRFISRLLSFYLMKNSIFICSPWCWYLNRFSLHFASLRYQRQRQFFIMSCQRAHLPPSQFLLQKTLIETHPSAVEVLAVMCSSNEEQLYRKMTQSAIAIQSFCRGWICRWRLRTTNGTLPIQPAAATFSKRTIRISQMNDAKLTRARINYDLRKDVCFSKRRFVLLKDGKLQSLSMERPADFCERKNKLLSCRIKCRDTQQSNAIVTTEALMRRKITKNRQHSQREKAMISQRVEPSFLLSLLRLIKQPILTMKMVAEADSAQFLVRGFRRQQILQLKLFQIAPCQVPESLGCLACLVTWKQRFAASSIQRAVRSFLGRRRRLPYSCFAIDIEISENCVSVNKQGNDRPHSISDMLVEESEREVRENFWNYAHCDPGGNLHEMASYLRLAILHGLREALILDEEETEENYTSLNKEGNNSPHSISDILVESRAKARDNFGRYAFCDQGENLLEIASFLRLGILRCLREALILEEEDTGENWTSVNKDGNGTHHSITDMLVEASARAARDNFWSSAFCDQDASFHEIASFLRLGILRWLREALIVDEEDYTD